MEYEDLQRAMAGSATTKQKLKGLDERYDYASALRDRPAPTAAPGTTNYLGSLAQLVGQSRGRAGVRDIGAQREPLRQQAGAGDTAVQGQRLKMAMEQAARQQTKADQGTEAHTLKLATNRGKAETWTDGTSNLPVVYDAENRPVDLQGNPVPEGYSPKERTYGLGGGGGRGKAMSYKDKVAFSEVASQVKNTQEIAGNFEPSFAQPTGLPTEFINNLATATSRNDLMKFIDKDTDQSTKEAAQWWADWRMFYTLPERHDKFGATLTRNEAEAWKQAENISPGMDPVEIQKRTQRLTEIARDNFARMADTAVSTSVSADREAIRRSAEGLLDYDEKANRFGIPTTSGGRVEFAPEHLAIVQGMGAQDRKDFDSLPNDVQMEILEAELADVTE